MVPHLKIIFISGINISYIFLFSNFDFFKNPKWGKTPGSPLQVPMGA
jgi:hypothetical protein